MPSRKLVYKIWAGGPLVHVLRSCGGTFLPLGRFLVRHGLGVGLVGWGGVEVTAKLFISGKGFDAVDAE
jgi:hypothetical protein